MPQATDDLRDRMGEYFGDRIAEWPPRAFLIDQGFEEKDGVWTLPEWRAIGDKEWDCLRFLFQEWDYDFRLEQDAAHT